MSKKLCLTLQTIPSVLQVTWLYNDFTQINFEASAYALGLFPSSSAILKEVETNLLTHSWPT